MVAYDRSLVVLPNLCAPVAGAVSTLSLTHHNPSGCLKSQPIQFVLHLKLLFTFLSPQYFSRPITDDAVTCKETKFIVSDVIQTQEIPNLSIPDGSTPSPEKKAYNMVPKCLRPYPKLSSLRLWQICRGGFETFFRIVRQVRQKLSILLYLLVIIIILFNSSGNPNSIVIMSWLVKWTPGTYDTTILTCHSSGKYQTRMSKTYDEANHVGWNCSDSACAQFSLLDRMI